MVRRMLPLLAIILTACGQPAPTVPAQPVAGEPAGPFAAVLPQLQAVAFPVFLPARLPTALAQPGARTAVSATGTTYAVVLRAGAASLIISGGPSSTVGTGMPAWTGAPQPVRLPDGMQAFFHPGQGIEWVEQRWRFAVVDSAADPQTPDTLTPEVEPVRQALPPFGNPIAPGTQGSVVAQVGATPPDMEVQWIQGAYVYDVVAHGVSGIAVAETLVQVHG